MKKLFCTLTIAALSGIGMLSAQTDALKITNDEIVISKPIKANEFVFNLPQVGLSIINKSEFVGGLGPLNPVHSISPAGTDESMAGPIMTQFDVGVILPGLSNRMDLGSKDNYFRSSYVYQPYHKIGSQSFSDARLKENVTDLTGAAGIILQLHPVKFDFKRTAPNEDTASLKNKVGFIAQEMMTVLPHSVGHLPDTDILTVDYSSVIPYLVKAFQESEAEKSGLKEQVAELDAQVADLQEQLASLQEIVQSLLSQDNHAAAPAPKGNAPQNSPKNTVKEAKLFQNLPNPFSERTLIRYELPKTAGNAYLQVFDMAGVMVRNQPLPATQETGQVEISAGELTPGAYTYTLVVSGKVIDSKRMVVTQ
ncbi:MAG: tail fiber domain-containing protein [Bacteroides sp.]|nr:tail fiber domain-containing protein [Bacteroides sp.]MCM1086483.1 tail fiber domain-containing protein [Bacteroides sp.]MCM1169449.1 tail fiber domain-containing protein [Bacteroides sp.]